MNGYLDKVVMKRRLNSGGVATARFVELAAVRHDRALARQWVVPVAPRLNEAVVAALGGAGDFVAHTEFALRPDGSTAVLEVAARAPGAMVSEAARLHAGVNLETCNLGLQAGLGADGVGWTGVNAGWVWVPVLPGEAHELGPYRAAAVAVTPGWLRSEAMLDHFGVTEATWRRATRQEPHFCISESPTYAGRAVAALAADPDVARWSGQVLSSGQLARVYGFTDADGTQADAWRYIVEVQDANLPADDTGYR